MNCLSRTRVLYVLLCLFCGSLVYCQSKGRINKSVPKKKDAVAAKPPKSYERVNSDVGPEDIRIVAKIFSIRSADASLESPCNKFRCTAEVIIEEIVQRGRTYSGNIEVGKKVLAFFPMTLEPTSKVFPSNSNQLVYSGLNPSEVFVADVSGAQAIDEPETDRIRILTYRPIK